MIRAMFYLARARQKDHAQTASLSCAVLLGIVTEQAATQSQDL